MWSSFGSAYLGADETTNCLLRRPDSLVPCTSTSVGIVLGDTRCGDGGAGHLDGGLGHVVLGLGLVLLLLSLLLVNDVVSIVAPLLVSWVITTNLVTGAAQYATKGTLDGAGGGVDVGLESRGVSVARHVDGNKSSGELVSV